MLCCAVLCCVAWHLAAGNLEFLGPQSYSPDWCTACCKSQAPFASYVTGKVHSLLHEPGAPPVARAKRLASYVTGKVQDAGEGGADGAGQHQSRRKVCRGRVQGLTVGGAQMRGALHVRLHMPTHLPDGVSSWRG